MKNVVVSFVMAVLFVFAAVGCTSNQVVTEPSTAPITEPSNLPVDTATPGTQEPAPTGDGVENESAIQVEKSGKEVGPSTKEGKITVGFCPSAMNTQYQMVLNGVYEIIDQLGGSDVVELIVQSPTSQAAQDEQVNIVEGWIEQGIDVIAVATENTEAMDPVFAQAAEKNIPIFMFNMPVADPSDYCVSNVGYDQSEAGKAIGEWVVDNYGDQNVKLAIIEGLPGVHNTQRLSGFMSAIAGHTNIEIVASQAADWSRDKAVTVMENILTANQEIDIVWGMYDDMALGAMSAIKQAGREGIAILGYDHTQDADESIRLGEMTATVDTRSTDMGRNLMKAIYAYVVEGQDQDKVIFSKPIVYDATNIDTFDVSEFESKN